MHSVCICLIQVGNAMLIIAQIMYFMGNHEEICRILVLHALLPLICFSLIVVSEVVILQDGPFLLCR